MFFSVVCSTTETLLPPTFYSFGTASHLLLMHLQTNWLAPKLGQSKVPGMHISVQKIPVQSGLSVMETQEVAWQQDAATHCSGVWHSGISAVVSVPFSLIRVIMTTFPTRIIAIMMNKVIWAFFNINYLMFRSI